MVWIKTERLPERLREDPVTAGLSEVMAEMAQELFLAVCALPQEFSAAVAGAAGLREWERLTGLQPAADASLEDRRAAVISRLVSGGSATTALIASMGRAMTGYETRVIEDFPSYTFSLRFFGPQPGFIQMDTSALAEALELIKPAHLACFLAHTTWADIHAAALTWAQLEAQFPTWAALESAYYIGDQEVVT